MYLHELQTERGRLLAERLPDTDGHVFVTDWLNADDRYTAVGLDSRTGLPAKFTAPMRSGLTVWAQSLDDLCLLTNVRYVDHGREVAVCDDDDGGGFETNGVTALDHWLGTRRVTAPWRMFKIPTRTFADSRGLYFMLNDQSAAGIADYVKTTGVWTLETFVALELYWLHRDWSKCFVYSVHMDKSLDVATGLAAPAFDVVSFDLETVSHEPNRIPTGENKTDIVFSAAVTRILHSTGERVHECVINLPIDPSGNAAALQAIRDGRPQHGQQGHLQQQGQQGQQGEFGLTRRVTVVNSEEELLRAVCAVFDGMPSLYVLLGYNSKAYDMLYMAKRLAYLGMPEVNRVHCHSGILTYGLNMLHIDMYLVVSKYFANELGSFKLKHVVREVLKGDAAKVDLDARHLRTVYRDIAATGRPPVDGDYSLANITRYNDVDSILVYRLWHDMRYNEFLVNVSKIYRLSLARVSQSTISEYLANKLLIDSFKRNVLFTQHHNANVVWRGAPAALVTRFDNETLAASDDAASYGGGFNYRDSRNAYRDVDMMDMVAYYPEMMAGFNLSHETVAVYRAGAMRALAEAVPAAPTGPDSLHLYRFCTHKSAADAATLRALADKDLAHNVDSRKYVSGSLDNASRITWSELGRLRDTDRIIVVVTGRRGLLSRLMETRNTIRNVAKETKRSLQQAMDGVSQMILKHELDELDDFLDPDDDADDDAADDDGGGQVEFEERRYTCRRDEGADEDEELVLVRSNVRLLATKELVRLPLDHLQRYRDMLSNEFARINSQYRNLKIVNSSVYGLLGSRYGLLRGKHVAAIATMLGRKYIIETAKCAVKHYGYRLVLSDTDSVFLAPTAATPSDACKGIVERMAALNAGLKLNSKTYANVFVIAKKTYFALHDEPFSRGINKNGPSLWSEVMYDMYREYIVRHRDVTLSGVMTILRDMYVRTYERLARDKSLVLCTMNVKEDASEYKTQTPAKKLMERMAVSAPNFVFGKSITYFHVLLNNPRTVSFALDHELEATPVSQINIYKFYGKISMAVFNIISTALVETNRRRGVYYNMNLADFNRLNLAAFVQARIHLKIQ